MPGVSTNECPVSLISPFSIIANELANRSKILNEVVSVFDGANTPARRVDALETIEVERMRTNGTFEEQKALELAHERQVDLID